MTDVIQRARDALAHMEAAWEDDDVPLPSDFHAIHNLIAEINAGRLIDVRRIEKISWGWWSAALVYDDESWFVRCSGGDKPARTFGYYPTALEAVAVAEREIR